MLRSGFALGGLHASLSVFCQASHRRLSTLPSEPLPSEPLPTAKPGGAFFSGDGPAHLLQALQGGARQPWAEPHLDDQEEPHWPVAGLSTSATASASIPSSRQLSSGSLAG